MSPNSKPLAGVDDEARQEILRRLEMIEAEEGVEILFAVESGSRAWGFPSPDSDYDARYVYRHPREWYLSLREARDVIERPILDDFDVSGWDLRKALRLLLKSNPPLYEWLRSPFVYREEADFRTALRGLAEAVYDRRKVANHYRQTALRDYTGSGGPATIKRYLYGLRALLSLAWLKQQGSLPPMNVQELQAGLDLSSDLRSAFAELIAEKAAAPERGAIKSSPLLDRWIAGELEAAEAYCQSLAPAEPDLGVADAFYRKWGRLT